MPAVYLMLGGSPRFAAYVGIGGDLREQVSQHLVKRESRVVTGTTAVGLNPTITSARSTGGSTRTSPTESG